MAELEVEHAKLEIRGATLLEGNDPGTVRHVWVLRGQEGAVHFVYMDWHPNATDDIRKIDTKFMIEFGHPLMPMAMDVGYHSPVPMNNMHLEMGPAEESCDWLDGAPCYVDGSSLRAKDAFTEWRARGRDMAWLFEYLADYYTSVFRTDGEGAPMEFMELLNTVLGLLDDHGDADEQ